MGYIITPYHKRKEFIEKVFAGVVFHIPGRSTPFSKAVMKRWSGVSWYLYSRYLLEDVPTLSECWVARIPTKVGRVVAWRNGGDRGDNNFLIYIEAMKEFHSRRSIKDTIDFISLVESLDDAVLFVGRPLGKRNKAYLEELLRGDSRP